MLHPIRKRTIVAVGVGLASIGALGTIIVIGTNPGATKQVVSVAASSSSTATTPSTVAESTDYATLPRQILSSAPANPSCPDTRASNQVQISRAPTMGPFLTSRVASGDAAITLDLSNIDPGRLTVETAIRAYPALVTKPGQGFNQKIGGTLSARALWVIEYSNIDISALTAPSISGETATSPAPYTAAMDFVDPVTGLVAFTMLCRG